MSFNLLVFTMNIDIKKTLASIITELAITHGSKLTGIIVNEVFYRMYITKVLCMIILQV